MAKSKKGKATSAAATVLTDEERRRREEQRQVQQLVLRLKKENASEEEIKRQKNRLKTDLKYSTQEKRDYWREQKKKNAETKRNVGAGCDPSSSSSGPPATGEAAGTGLGPQEERVGESEACSVDVAGGGGTTSSGILVGPNSNKRRRGEETDRVQTAKAGTTTAQDDEDLSDSAEEADENLQKQHEVIIIPIVWRGRHDRHLLMEAAENVKRVLAQQGINTWIDSRRQHTPGQKFAFWEHKGVKFRIEIGPKDFERGKLCLCKHPVIPGDFQNTKKIFVPLPPEGARELLVQLQKFGFEKLQGTIRDADEQGENHEAGGEEVPRDYSTLYDRSKEIGGTVADYTHRFSSTHEVTKFGGGGILKPGVGDRSGASGDALTENFQLTTKQAAEEDDNRATQPKKKKRKVR
ncbi:unnamed protein product [Amoebophrya sp. A120]|nr:unnamed protein product [Amoebophrya sp. A120]|eukprot:GSA120T00025685001.1